ncbi:uncharacterized protein LOC135832503 [Planococcus citri]|uniref:uncharacterized protein LOC135832503 n=1 Tax=Planococcus citri TaxID=170843 RepID=UPI0031F7B858
MASEQKKGYRKLSGILKSRTFDSGLDHRDNRGVKIYIKNQYGNNGALPPEIDEEQFEHLKDMYYKQCQPINANLIRKLTEKRTASNYNYYDSAQCSRVIPPRIDSAHHNVVSSMARPSRRDVAVNSRDQKSSGNGRSGAVKKPDTNTRNHSCAKCHRRHY